MSRYKFLPYKGINSKGTCRFCGKKRHWSYYYDTETGKRLNESYGKCDNSLKCAAHYSPYEFPPEESDFTEEIIAPKEKKNYLSIIKQEVLDNTLINKYEDNFSKWLVKTFGEGIKKTLDEYFIGNYGKYRNTVFWQIDEKNRIRAGKVISYNAQNGKRCKDYTNWMHSLLKIPDYNLIQCFFGLHLINKYPDKKICVVEGEKNAVVASCLYPDFLFLAAGQLYGLSEQKLLALEGRNVVFYPDKSFFHVWKNRLEKIKPPFKYHISEVLEVRNDLNDGDDLVDMILKDKIYLNKNLAV